MKEFTGFRKGVNLGGWLSQCEYRKEHYDSFITESDIERIASWGLDHIRLPIDWQLVEEEDGAPIEANYKYIDDCISWCKNHGLNMILDLHKTAGYAFDELETAKDLFKSEVLQRRFIGLWEKLSAKYGKYCDFLVFELLNEVVFREVSDEWNALAKRAIAAIRENAPKTKIIVGGVEYNSLATVKLLDPPYDENIVYTFHCYEPLIFTHQKAPWIAEMPPDLEAKYPGAIGAYREHMKRLSKENQSVFGNSELRGEDIIGPGFFEMIFAEAIRIARERGVPLYCGEYGVIDRAPVADTLNWYRDINSVFEKNGIGRAAWSYKKMDFGLIDPHYEPILNELIRLL